MDREAKAVRVAALTEMFIGYGQEATRDRLTYYGTVTQYVPQAVFVDACRLAAFRDAKGWLPSPGQIVEAALELAPGPQDSGSGERLKPRWYRAMLTPDRRERARLCVGPVPAGSLAERIVGNTNEEA